MSKCFNCEKPESEFPMAHRGEDFCCEWCARKYGETLNRTRQTRQHGNTATN